MIRRTWTATDACGNAASGVQVIRVVDTTPPVFTHVPGDVELGCNPPATSPDVTGRAEAQDNCDPNPVVTYTDQISQEGCRVTIVRTWTAQDACGNTAQEMQRITYTLDQTPPVIHCPGNITRYIHECIDPYPQVWVDFPMSATDNCDPAPQVSCSPAGGWFPVGTTPVTITCTACDQCGNETTRTCSFTVTVVNENNPPVAWSVSVDAPDGIACVPVPAYDPDGDPLTITVSDPSPCGTTWVEGNNICYGTFGCEGWQIPPGTVARFSFTVTDPCGASATGWVYVRILCEVCPTAVPPEGGP